MVLTPSRKSGNGKGRDRKFRSRDFGSPQVVLPSHLSGWPDVKVPKAPNSAPKYQSGRKDFASAKTSAAVDRPHQVKASQPNGVSTGAGKEGTDFDDITNSSPLTLEDGSSERKERMKDATASQKRDKSTGKRKNKEKGGSENVFNARSPTQKRSTIRMSDKNGTPIRTNSPANIDNSPAFSLPNSTTKAVPFRIPPVADTRTEQKTAKAKGHQSSQGRSAAVTEAQLQANLLRKSGHREFSSHAFDGSDEAEIDQDIDGGPTQGTKKTKKKSGIEDAKLDPVKAEIAKQQANYKDIMSERMKKNPDHYFNDDVNVIHELTSDGESDQERIYDRRGLTKGGIGDKITAIEYRSGSASKVSTLSSVTQDNDDQTLSTTKKDKDHRKRTRAGEDESEKIADVGRSRKRLRTSSGGKHRSPGMETRNHSTGGRGSSDDSRTRRVAKGESAATHIQHQKPVSFQQTRNAPPMTVITDNADANAEFIATLKSFWSIIPKALLHTTMTNLNKANRHSLDAKLKACQQGKQTNPHIRIVTRTDENEDENELLEEYGKINELDPYTMSSELTLLTAAKGLIVSLSAQRIGVGLSSAVSSSRDGETKSVGGNNRGQLVQGCERSLMEEELTRIAGEYQKEIDKLREENGKLTAKLKKSKK